MITLTHLSSEESFEANPDHIAYVFPYGQGKSEVFFGNGKSHVCMESPARVSELIRSERMSFEMQLAQSKQRLLGRPL